MIVTESTAPAGKEAEKNPSFFSLLYLQGKNNAAETFDPSALLNLNIENIIKYISHDNKIIESHLKKLLPDKESVLYRQKIFKDLENTKTIQAVRAFSKNIQNILKIKAKAKKFHNRNNEKITLLDLCSLYVESIKSLYSDLSLCPLQSDGLIKFKNYLFHYLTSHHFTSLSEEAKALKNRFIKTKYILKIKGNIVSVYRYENEESYLLDLNKTFNEIIDENSKSYVVEFTKFIEMNHIETQILDLVLTLQPQLSDDLNNFYIKNNDFLDPNMLQFEEDFNFYSNYIQLMSSLRESGLCFCYPDISYQKDILFVNNTFDVALAIKALKEKDPIVCNDINLNDDERILVISGPNQGGKTTFSRIFGQIHYLTRLGCPIPGTEASLFFFDSIFTHFEKQETL